MQKIIADFESFMIEHGTHYHQFYVGVASDPKDRLVNGHNVNNSIPAIWTTNPMHTDVVRSVEEYFLNKGTKGGPGGGDSNTQYVYAYLINASTRE